MNKTDLVKELSAELKISQSRTKVFIDSFQRVVTRSLQGDDPVMLQGFGSFSHWEQTERPARNPKTGVPCMIKPRISVKFKPGKFLLETLNSKSKKKASL